MEQNVKKRFIIIGTGQKNNILNEAFYEVINGKIENAEFIDPYKFPNSLIKKLYGFRYSAKGRKWLSLLPNSIWNGYSFFNNLKIADDEKVYLLFVIGRDVERLFVPSILDKIKNKYKDRVCNCLILFDSIEVTKSHNKWGEITDCFSHYDKVATFDLKDAKKYNLIHFWDPYSKRENLSPSTNKKDLFFIGVDKGRLDILNKIAEKAKEKHLSCDFRVFQLDKEKEINGITRLEKFLPYNEMLKEVLSSNCLVEILAKGQSSSSFRYYESVVYNKKLITNNPNIFDMPFYNSDYMQYFDDPNKLDVEWISKDVTVDYGYKDEFSILQLFEKLK